MRLDQATIDLALKLYDKGINLKEAVEMALKMTGVALKCK